jgi:hypothetical protein
LATKTRLTLINTPEIYPGAFKPAKPTVTRPREEQFTTESHENTNFTLWKV